MNAAVMLFVSMKYVDSQQTDIPDLSIMHFTKINHCTQYHFSPKCYKSHMAARR
jgi:hypothetical protein